MILFGLAAMAVTRSTRSPAMRSISEKQSSWDCLSLTALQDGESVNLLAIGVRGGKALNCADRCEQA